MKSKVSLVVNNSNSNPSSTSDGHYHYHYQPSAIANIVNKRIHLEPAIPIPPPPVEIEVEHKYEYDDFLITVRNPIERIVSWFNYIHLSYPPRKSKRHINGCDGYLLDNLSVLEYNSGYGRVWVRVRHGQV